jgi:hypothetical protein
MVFFPNTFYQLTMTPGRSQFNSPSFTLEIFGTVTTQMRTSSRFATVEEERIGEYSVGHADGPIIGRGYYRRQEPPIIDLCPRR